MRVFRESAHALKPGTLLRMEKSVGPGVRVMSMIRTPRL
jgi:hypothetical protein